MVGGCFTSRGGARHPSDRKASWEEAVSGGMEGGANNRREWKRPDGKDEKNGWAAKFGDDKRGLAVEPRTPTQRIHIFGDPGDGSDAPRRRVLRL